MARRISRSTTEWRSSLFN